MLDVAIPLRIERVDRLESLEEEWSDLGATGRNIFNTWEWNALWWRHFGRERELALGAALDADDEVVAILPLYFWRARPGRVLRFLGHGASDELGPISRNRDRVAARDALLAYLRASRSNWDVILAEHLPSEENWGRILGATSLRRESNFVLHDDGDGWDGFLASRSANFRQQVGKRERRLARRHDLHYRLADDPARLGEDLDTLFALHAGRWPGRSSAFAGVREAFHREFAARALERGWLRLWFLELDGRPVAAWYGFRFGDAESAYQTGRDPAFDHASVGFVLYAQTIRAAFADGVAEYRFLRGDDEYKLRFTSEDHPLETVALASSTRGQALLAAARGLRFSSRIRKALRAPLEA